MNCPKCGLKARLLSEAAQVGLSPNIRTEEIWICDNGCKDSCWGLPATQDFEPDPDCPGMGISYKPLTFLSNGDTVC